MEDLKAAQTNLNNAVDEIYKKVDEMQSEIEKLTPDTYAEKYIASRTGELRAVLRGEVQRIANQIEQELKEVLPRYSLENRLRKASLTGSDDPAVEGVARHQKLTELQLRDEAGFTAECNDALKTRNLAVLDLALMAMSQRGYKDGSKKSILKSEISEMLLPESKILEEITEKAQDLESAVKAAKSGNSDGRREMHQAVARYRKKQAEKERSE